MTETTFVDRPNGRRSFGGAVWSEWTKLRTVPSTPRTLLLVVAATIAISIVAMAWYPGHWAHLSAADKASFDPTNDSLTGLALGQLAMGVLGVLSISAEYSAGTIRATLSAVPNRLVVLAAKTIVVGLVCLAVGEAVSFVAFVIGQAVLGTAVPHATLGQPGVARAVALAGVYLAVVGLIGLGLGLIIRHTAGAVAAFAAIVLVLPAIVSGFPSARHSVGRLLPDMIAANSLSAVHHQSPYLGPWAGLGILCLYLVVLLGLGGLALVRRDA